jgi:hypothetical protein
MHDLGIPCPNCKGQSWRKEFSAGAVFSGLAGLAVKLFSRKLSFEGTSSEWACQCDVCGSIFAVCPFCDCLVSVASFQIGSKIKCKYCLEDFLFS